MRITFFLFAIAMYSVCFAQDKIVENKDALSSNDIIGQMFISTSNLRANCDSKIKMMTVQGYQTEGLENKLASLPESYDAILGFALELTSIPIREDFNYDEPFDLEEIQAARPDDRNDVLKHSLSKLEIRD